MRPMSREDKVLWGLLATVILAAILASGCACVIPDYAARGKGMDPDRPRGLFVRSTAHVAGVCATEAAPTGEALHRVKVWATVTGQAFPGAVARARISRLGVREELALTFGRAPGGTWTLEFPAGPGPAYKVEFWVGYKTETVYGYTRVKVYDCRAPGYIRGAVL